MEIQAYFFLNFLADTFLSEESILLFGLCYKLVRSVPQAAL